MLNADESSFADNVDYNDIKQLIKLHTTKDEAFPTPIPGREAESKEQRSFEDELELELCNQHKRIDLFVQSKAGEIGRRLCMCGGGNWPIALKLTGQTVHLDKQVAQLKSRTGASTRNTISVRRLERFSRLEEEILKCVGVSEEGRLHLTRLIEPEKKSSRCRGLWARNG
jgi:hypothetical protein